MLLSEEENRRDYEGPVIIDLPDVPVELLSNWRGNRSNDSEWVTDGVAAIQRGFFLNEDFDCLRLIPFWDDELSKVNADQINGGTEFGQSDQAEVCGVAWYNMRAIPYRAELVSAKGLRMMVDAQRFVLMTEVALTILMPEDINRPVKFVSKDGTVANLSPLKRDTQ